MKILRFCCALLCSAGLLLEAASAQTPGATPSSAAPAGVPIAGILECGEGYTSHELYDVTITLEEVLRGDEALRRLRAAAPHTPEAPPGLDYVLARVRFEYRARGFPGTCVHPLAPEQFTAYSREGEAYAAAPVPPPEPGMRREMKTGDAVTGWLAYLVAETDRSPLLSFAADRGGAVQHGEPKWFLLR
ncbi:MAG: hypothetical protein QM330_10525 [Acidobacteriota bacterium]|jgi:hypothetical protein|nr:hypothetical protein [Acidobacteriota bacterium]NLT33486.1 hypothetical protein [Acidobacteriota bacterium]